MVSFRSLTKTRPKYLDAMSDQNKNNDKIEAQFTQISHVNEDSNFFCTGCNPNQVINTFEVTPKNLLTAIMENSTCYKCDRTETKTIENQRKLVNYLTQIFKANFFKSIFFLIGSNETRANFKLLDFKGHLLDLTKIDIPEDAHVLDVNLSSAGPLSPIENHGNSVFSKQNYDLKKINIWPVPAFPTTKASNDTDVTITVKWINSDDRETHRNIIEMLKGYQRRDQNQFILGGHQAIECLITKICTIHLSGTLTPTATQKNEINSRFSYNTHLKYIFPLVSQTYNFPFEDTIVNILCELASNRNSVAHNGQLLTRRQKPRLLNDNEYVARAANVLAAYALLSNLLLRMEK